MSTLIELLHAQGCFSLNCRPKAVLAPEVESYRFSGGKLGAFCKLSESESGACQRPDCFGLWTYLLEAVFNAGIVAFRETVSLVNQKGSRQCSTIQRIAVTCS